jgi:hypothetical protein
VAHFLISCEAFSYLRPNLLNTKTKLPHGLGFTVTRLRFILSDYNLTNFSMKNKFPSLLCLHALMTLRNTLLHQHPDYRIIPSIYPLTFIDHNKSEHIIDSPPLKPVANKNNKNYRYPPLLLSQFSDSPFNNPFPQLEESPSPAPLFQPSLYLSLSLTPPLSPLETSSHSSEGCKASDTFQPA